MGTKKRIRKTSTKPAVVAPTIVEPEPKPEPTATEAAATIYTSACRLERPKFVEWTYGVKEIEAFRKAYAEFCRRCERQQRGKV